MKILLNETSVEFLVFEVILKIFQTSISMHLFLTSIYYVSQFLCDFVNLSQAMIDTTFG